MKYYESYPVIVVSSFHFEYQGGLNEPSIGFISTLFCCIKNILIKVDSICILFFFLI
jgi:hypothetical protein